MRPVLWGVDLPFVGEFTFTAYYTLLTVGFGLAIWLMWREARRTDLDPDRIFDLCLWVIISSIVGLFWWFVILKAVTRAVVELLRDDDRGSVALLSTSQLVSLLLLSLAVFMLRRCRRLGKKQAA